MWNRQAASYNPRQACKCRRHELNNIEGRYLYCEARRAELRYDDVLLASMCEPRSGELTPAKASNIKHTTQTDSQ